LIPLPAKRCVLPTQNHTQVLKFIDLSLNTGILHTAQSWSYFSFFLILIFKVINSYETKQLWTVLEFYTFTVITFTDKTDSHQIWGNFEKTRNFKVFRKGILEAWKLEQQNKLYWLMDYFKIRVFYPWVICLCVFIWIHAWSHGQDRHDGKIYIYLSFMMVSQWYGNCFHYMYLPPNTSSILMNNIEYLLVTFLLYGMYVFCKATDIDENIANQNHATDPYTYTETGVS
jgi:hypothetical protein